MTKLSNYCIRILYFLTSVWTEIRDSFLYFLLTFTILFVSFYLYYKFDQKPETLPAWIQAVGTVLAVIVTFWVGTLNRKKERQERKENILAVAKSAHDYVAKIDQELKKNKNDQIYHMELSNIRSIYHADILKTYGIALSKLDISQIRSSEAIHALKMMETQIKHFLPHNIDAMLTESDNITIKKGMEETRTYNFSRIKAMEPQFEEIKKYWDIIKRTLA